MPWMHYVKSEDHSWGDHNVQTLCVSGNWPKKSTLCSYIALFDVFVR